MRRLKPLFAFLGVVAVAGAATIRPISGAVTSGESVSSTAGRDLTPREQAIHVLNRLAFGPTPGEIDQVMKMGVDRWIDQQLHPDRIPDRELTSVLTSYSTLDKSASELIRDYPPPQQLRAQLGRDNTLTRQDSMQLRREAQQNRAFAGEILSARVARAVVTDRQLQEVMTDFWENHFTVFIGKGQQIRYFIPEYDRDVIRPNALGHFRDLLGAVAHSPAMLFYLDNAQSVADSGRPTLSRSAARGGRRGGGFDPRGPGAARRPGGGILRPGGGRQLPPDIRDRIARGDTVGMRDRAQQLMQQLQQRRPRGINENYARELLELHTLGVDGGYTQKDVIEVARALTGWSIQPPRSGQSGFLFRPEAHDAGEKVVLGHTLRAGRGVEDGEEVLDIIARQSSTARFIARKLCVRFVSDSPPPALVDRAAATFTKTNGDIRAVVRTIVTSPEFFSRAAFRAKVKSPFEVTVSTLRALGAQADTTPRTAQLVAFLGQPIFGHQAPNGWPETGDAWMNTGAILNRINFGLAVAAGRVPGAQLANWPLYGSLVDAPREAQVDSVIAVLLSGRASPETKEILLSGNNPMLAQGGRDSVSAARDDLRNNPARDTVNPIGQRPLRPGPLGRGGGAGFGALPQLNGLAQVVGLALGSPEFQRR
jgi:uncharacterized protein (DUF1800 family)